MTDLMLVFASALAGARLVIDRPWAPAVVLPQRRPVAQEWLTGPGARDSFVTGGLRGLLDRSPMRFDVTVYLGSL